MPYTEFETMAVANTYALLGHYLSESECQAQYARYTR